MSSSTPLKPQHSNSNPKPLANQLWYIDLLTPHTPLIIPHRLPAFLECLIPLKNWFSIHARCSKSSLKHSIRSVAASFQSLKQNFIAYRSSSRPDCIFEILQLWQSGSSNVYSNCCCSFSLEPEIIKISQSSHKMYCNNTLNSQESTIILNTCTKNSGNLLNAHRIYIYIYIYDEGHWYAHTRGLPWGLREVVGTVQLVHGSRRRLLRRGLVFHMCTINKSAHTKKVWKII